MIRDDSFPFRGVLIGCTLGLLFVWGPMIAAVIWWVMHR